MPRWICARSSASSWRWSARLCRQSRRASRITSLLEAYSPAATAVRTASAISGVRVMVKRSIVFINHTLSYCSNFLVSRFRFAGGRSSGSRSVPECSCAGRCRESPQCGYSFGGFTTSPAIVNFELPPSVGGDLGRSKKLWNSLPIRHGLTQHTERDCTLTFTFNVVHQFIGGFECALD